MGNVNTLHWGCVTCSELFVCFAKKHVPIPPKCTIDLDQTLIQFELIGQQFQTSTMYKKGALKKNVLKFFDH